MVACSVESVARRQTVVLGVIRLHAHHQELLAHAMQRIQPATQYFLRRSNLVEHDVFPLSLSHLPRAAFKAARLCCPKFIHKTRPYHSQPDALQSFPALDADEAIHD